MSQKNESFIKMPISLIKYSEISVMDRLLYGIITNLTNRTGICTASNAYLADLFGVSIKTIERSFKVLREKKLIDTVNIYENDTKRILRRDTIIVPSNLSFDTLKLSNSTLKSEGRVPSNLSFDTLKSEGDNKINIKEDNKREINAPFHFASLSDLIKELKTTKDLKDHKPIKATKELDDYLNSFEYQTDEDKQIVDYVLDIGYCFIKYRDYMYKETKDNKYKIKTFASIKKFINTIINSYSHIDLENLFEKLESKGWATIEKGWIL